MNDRAVSTVIGTVLVLGIVVSAMVLYQLNVVPDLTEQTESRHMDDAARSMSELGADLHRQLREVSHTPVSSSVPVEAENPPFTPDTSSSSTVSFEGGTSSTTIASPSFTVVTRNGSSTFAGGSGSSTDWQPISGGETIEDVESVIGLRIKITKADPADGDMLRINATDAQGDYAGDLAVLANVNPPDLDLIVQTREPPLPGTTIFHNHILSIHQGRWDSDYWIDAMLDLYWFDAVLEDADKPAVLAFEDLGLDAEYKIAYEEQTGAGMSVVVGGGQTFTDYEREIGTGRLTFEAQNEYYPDQDLVLEHGALLRAQTDGSAFLTDPPLQVEASDNVVELGLDVPALEGDDDAVSGTGTATIRTQNTDRETLGANAGELELTWVTQHPDRWASWLDDELSEAGLTSTSCPPQSPSSTCQYEITTSGEEVSLAVHGPHAQDADPTDPEIDIVLHLKRGAIQTEVQK